MSELNEKIKQLLESGKVNIMIGYSEGAAGNVKPFFSTDPSEAEKFIFDERCLQNLAVYVNNPEIKTKGKMGIVAHFPAVKSILQLAAENQISDGQVIAISVSPDGKVSELNNFAEMESFVANPFPDKSAPLRQKIEEIMKMSPEMRWKYWTNEMANCIKCYACRSACPLCYCTQCTVECNQPQWIPVSPHHQGNLEWHLMRAMHLAGRCIGCGECTRACPVDIPVGMLSLMLNDYIKEEFGQVSGMKSTPDYALSSFRVHDKENFMR